MRSFLLLVVITITHLFHAQVDASILSASPLSSIFSRPPSPLVIQTPSPPSTSTSNPVNTLLSSLQATVATAYTGTVDLSKNTVNSIKTRSRLSNPKTLQHVTYKQFKAVGQSFNDAKKIATLSAMALIAPSYISYAVIFYPTSFLPSTYLQKKEMNGKLTKAYEDETSKYITVRNNKILTCLMDIEESALTVGIGIFQNINPFSDKSSFIKKANMEANSKVIDIRNILSTTKRRDAIKLIEDKFCTSLTLKTSKSSSKLNEIKKPMLLKLVDITSHETTKNGCNTNVPSVIFGWAPKFLVKRRVISHLNMLKKSDDFLILKAKLIGVSVSAIVEQEFKDKGLDFHEFCLDRVIGNGSLRSTDKDLMFKVNEWLSDADRVKAVGYSENRGRMGWMALNSVEGVRGFMKREVKESGNAGRSLVRAVFSKPGFS